jgi:DNA-binding Xre family transcriptional regulator
MTPLTAEQEQHFARALGHELRRIRTARKWTRKTLLAEMRNDISTHTLAAYEQGTRTISVARLLAICTALEVHPATVLDQAQRDAFDTSECGLVRVNLTMLAGATDPRLQQLHRWARTRASQLPSNREPVEELDTAALTSLAAVCGIDSTDLARSLGALGPKPSSI